MLRHRPSGSALLVLRRHSCINPASLPVQVHRLIRPLSLCCWLTVIQSFLPPCTCVSRVFLSFKANENLALMQKNNIMLSSLCPLATPSQLVCWTASPLSIKLISSLSLTASQILHKTWKRISPIMLSPIQLRHLGGEVISNEWKFTQIVPSMKPFLIWIPRNQLWSKSLYLVVTPHQGSWAILLLSWTCCCLPSGGVLQHLFSLIYCGLDCTSCRSGQKRLPNE